MYHTARTEPIVTLSRTKATKVVKVLNQQGLDAFVQSSTIPRKAEVRVSAREWPRAIQALCQRSF